MKSTLLKSLKLGLLSGIAFSFTSLQADPVPVIFDTDIGNDVDDVLALGVLHNLEKRGASKLLAVTITKDSPKAASFTDAVNHFYGRPDIPIGVVKDGATPNDGKFLILADRAEDYPHKIKSREDAQDALKLLRKTLAEQPDGSVTLIQVGFFTNFCRLLDTPGDEYSPLNGKELIKQKVKLLSVMAGAFQSIEHNNRYIEYNVKIDIPSAQKLAKEWPTDIVWSGFEIGIAAAYPHQSIEQDFNYVAHHPIKEAYYLYNKPPHDRPTWDLTSVLAAVYSDRGYFDYSKRGKVVIDDDGFTRFIPSKEDKGRDRFLIMNDLQSARVKEALVQLCVEPPTTLSIK